MNLEEVQAILDNCEQALTRGGSIDLGQCGFWQAVNAVERQPFWIPRFADRIAAIDRAAFDRAVRYRLPLRLGIAGLTTGALVGLALAAAGAVSRGRWRDLFFLAGTGALLVTTHDLAHFVVGRRFGIAFSEMFFGGKALIEPGLKIDYATYLRAPPRERAWMQAAGAITTKVVAILAFLTALTAGFSARVSSLLGGLALLAIVTDLFWSTRYSDWRRFGRQLRLARRLERAG